MQTVKNQQLGWQNSSHSAITTPTIDMLVYAGDTLPVGARQLDTPDPVTVALTGLGLAVSCRRPPGPNIHPDCGQPRNRAQRRFPAARQRRLSIQIGRASCRERVEI